jgi:hypothetical protein
MYTRPLRCRKGRVRFWNIGPSGVLTCSLDPELVPAYRVTSGTKKYRQVQLMVHKRLQWFYVHRLMAFSWLGDPPHFLRTIVDHINGNSLCNNIENLRWVTRTANNINKRCYGLFLADGLYYPKIAGFTHRKYGFPTEQDAHDFRHLLVECYVRFTMKHPESGNEFPHYSIHNY